jgi:P-type conjugative transfer protein TrbJ
MNISSRKGSRLQNAVAVAVLASVLSVGQVNATGIPVVDAANLSQTMITAVNAVTSVANQAMQIANEVRMIQNQLQSLSTLGESSFGAVNANLNNQLYQLNSVLNTVKGVGFQIGNVDSQFRAMFPEGTDWSTKDVGQYGGYFDKWSAQVQDSARTAMQSQGVIENIRRNNAETSNILSQAKGADGEVRQLQAVNQMLGVLASQMGDMTVALTAGGRSSASIAAAGQAERDAQRALMDKFNAPVVIPTGDGGRF